MMPDETNVSNNGFRANFLLTLHRHLQWLFFYGLIQIGVAVIISSIQWNTKNQIFLPETNEVFSHPPLIILFITLLLINAMVFAIIAATHGAFWFRFIITSIVALLLLIFGWRIGAFTFIVLPVCLMGSYVLWRGSRPIPGHPTIKDILIFYVLILAGWLLVVAFGIRLSNMPVIVTLYIGMSQLLVFASVLPIPQILISGIDLADLTMAGVERITAICARLGNKVVLITLLTTSVVKLGFIIWSGGLGSLSNWIIAAIFSICFIGLVFFTPKRLLDFKPRFKHWLFLSGFIFPLPIAVLLTFIMLGGHISTAIVGSFLIGAIGPIGLIIAGVLAFFPKHRPFSIFTTLMAIWGLLTFSLTPLCKLLLGIEVAGLNIWYLDGLAAILFIIWSICLLYQQKSSLHISIALKFSLFLSGCFMLDQMLNHKVVIAELYTVFQALTYLAIHQFIVRPKQLRWSQVISWLIVLILLIHSLWIKILPDGIINMITVLILIISMLWDVLIADEKITGQKINGPERPGLLFLYLGVVTWTIAQIVFAKTGKGTAVLEWEPIILLGLIVIGIPWVFYNFLMEIKTNLPNQA